MPIQVKCSCGKLLNVSESLAGKKGRCPACSAIFTIPHDEDNGEAGMIPKSKLVSNASRKKAAVNDDSSPYPKAKSVRRDDEDDDEDLPRKRRPRARDEDDLEDDDDEEPRSRKRKPKGNSSMVIVVVLLLVGFAVILLGAGGFAGYWFLIRKSDSSSAAKSSGSSASSSQESASETVFEGTRHVEKPGDYSYVPPKDWQQEPGGRKAKFKPRQEAGDASNITSSDGTAAISLDEFVDTVLPALKDAIGNYQLLQRGNFQTGEGSTRVVLEIQQKGVGIRQHYYFYSNGSRKVTLICTGLTAAAAKNEPVFDACARSLRFEKK
jgi:hypothetical protein